MSSQCTKITNPPPQKKTKKIPAHFPSTCILEYSPRTTEFLFFSICKIVLWIRERNGQHKAVLFLDASYCPFWNIFFLIGY